MYLLQARHKLNSNLNNSLIAKDIVKMIADLEQWVSKLPHHNAVPNFAFNFIHSFAFNFYFSFFDKSIISLNFLTACDQFVFSSILSHFVVVLVAQIFSVAIKLKLLELNGTVSLN